VDIADKLLQRNWLIMLFHHDCPDCARTLPEFLQIADSFAGNEDTLQLALVEIPPFGYDPTDMQGSYCILGRMDEIKKWLVVTPAVLLLTDGTVRHAWKQGVMPTFDEVLERIAELIQ
jgi:thiol-disulfide isomerase/thioredoxin